MSAGQACSRFGGMENLLERIPAFVTKLSWHRIVAHTVSQLRKTKGPFGQRQTFSHGKGREIFQP